MDANTNWAAATTAVTVIFLLSAPSTHPISCSSPRCVLGALLMIGLMTREVAFSGFASGATVTIALMLALYLMTGTEDRSKS